jgi:ActR/RegA family two-component response regulator
MGEKGVEGLSLIQRIKSHDPQAHILVLSMHRDPIIVARAVEAGANGYILKETATDDLLTAIQTIQQGKSYLSQDLAKSAYGIDVARGGDANAACGQGPIVEELNVSYTSVVGMSSRLRRKLDARNSTRIGPKGSSVACNSQ